MPKMTLKYDKEAEALIEELKLFFGLKTNAATIRRALAIARAARRHAYNGAVTFANPSDPKKRGTFLLV